MINEISWKALICFFFAFAVLFVIAELLYHKLKIDVEYTRKTVHISTGIISLFFPNFLEPLDLVLVCIAFTLFMFASKTKSFFQSVNSIDRLSNGVLLFPLVIFCGYFIQYFLGNYGYYLIPISILSISDPLAAWIGKSWPIRSYSLLGNHKSIGGSVAFFISSTCIAFGGIVFVNGNWALIFLGCAVTIGILTTIAEAIAVKGWDNLWIPLASILVLWLYNIL